MVDCRRHVKHEETPWLAAYLGQEPIVRCTRNAHTPGVSTLFASRLAPDVAIALEQAPSLGVRDLSRALRRTASSVQRALPALLHAGIVVRDPDGSHSLNNDAGAAFLELALQVVPPERILSIVANANPAVEFAAIDPEGLLVITRWSAELGELARLDAVLERLEQRAPDMRRRLVLDSDSLRERLSDEPNLRARALRAAVLKGAAERTFPDVTRHGDFASPAIHALNPALRRPAATRLRALADRFALRRIIVFGSAVRRDLRPDSDVDVLIEPEDPDRVDLDSYLGTREALEALFGRRVDLVVRGTLRPGISERADAEGVAIYERSRPRRSSAAA